MVSHNFTVDQLKSAFVELYKRNDKEGLAGYQLCYDLLEAKLGEDAFDEFCDEVGI